MAHDGDYFRRRESEARAAAFCREQDEEAEVAGQLALAYGALARRHLKSAAQVPPAMVEDAQA